MIAGNYQDQELLDLLEEQVRVEAQTNLLKFAMYCLPYYEPSWFHHVLCKKLDDFVNKKIPRLMVFMPPRHGKSELVSRCLPAYIFGREPNAAIIGASYNTDLATDMNRDAQRIMDTEEYKRIFPFSRIPPIGSAREGAVRNNTKFEVMGHRGVYRAVGVGKGITGKGGDFMIIDDVIKDQMEADSPTYRDRVWGWFVSTFFTRAQSAKASILLTMTRWHEDDLAGRLLKLANENEQADQWEVLSMPAVLDGEPGPGDTRELGDVLWPERFPIEHLEKYKAAGSRVWNALFQQRPSALEGNIIQRAWIRLYDELPEGVVEWKQFWDLTFKGKEDRRNSKSGSFVVGQVWCRKGANFYLVDQYRARPDFPGTLQAIRAMSQQYPQAVEKNIEDAANGPAVVASLRDEIPGLVLVSTKGASKESRLHTASPYFESGNVWFPRRNWTPELVEELVTFPNALNDDQTDTVSMAVNKYKDSHSGFTLDLGFGLKEESWRY